MAKDKITRNFIPPKAGFRAFLMKFQWLGKCFTCARKGILSHTIKYCNRVMEISIYGVIFFIPISNAFIESFISLAIFAWLVKKITQKTKPTNIFYPNQLNIPLFLYLLVCIASTLFSSDFGISSRHLFFKTLEYLLLFFIIVEILDKRILKNILITVVISTALLGIDGIFQYFTNWDFFRHRTPIIRTRINASFYYPNDFATYIVTLLPLVASASFLKYKKIWIRPLIMVISFILFICMMLSATRSVWVAMVLAIIFACILRQKKLALFMLIMIAISLSLFPFLSDLAKERIRDFLTIKFNDAGGYLHRKFLLYTGLGMFKERPILGQGLGTFMFNFERFQPQNYYWGICYAHNCFLQIAAETGILGLSAFISIIVSLFLTAYKYIKRIKENYFYYATLSGFLIGVFSYLIDAFFDTSLYSLPLAVLFWLMLGLTVATINLIKKEALPNIESQL